MVKKLLFSATLASIIFLFPTSAFSDELEQVFEQLKDSGEDYRPEGSICEQVAKLELEHEYPKSKYDIITGIGYSNHKQLLGELDVVVFDSTTQKVALISEVKCWQNFKKAYHKAREQRQRFQHYVDSGAPLQFYLVKKSNQRYDESQFHSSAPFITVSQDGGQAAGFDLTLHFNLSEMKELRQKLLECQKQGVCQRPSNVRAQ